MQADFLQYFYPSTDLPIHRSTDPLIYRSIDLLFHRYTDPLIYRSIDLLFHRSTDPSIYWSIDLPIHRSTVPSIYCSIDLLFHRSTDPLIYRSTDLPIHWSTDPLIYRSIDLPIHRSTIPSIYSSIDLLTTSAISLQGVTMIFWEYHLLIRKWNTCIWNYYLIVFFSQRDRGRGVKSVIMPITSIKLPRNRSVIVVDLEPRLVWSWKFSKVRVVLTCPTSLSSTVFNY